MRATGRRPHGSDGRPRVRIADWSTDRMRRYATGLGVNAADLDRDSLLRLIAAAVYRDGRSTR